MEVLVRGKMIHTSSLQVVLLLLPLPPVPHHLLHHLLLPWRTEVVHKSSSVEDFPAGNKRCKFQTDFPSYKVKGYIWSHRKCLEYIKHKTKQPNYQKRKRLQENKNKNKSYVGLFVKNHKQPPGSLKFQVRFRMLRFFLFLFFIISHYFE